MVNAILYILIGMLIAAVIVGIVVVVLATRTQGTLRIDRSNPTKDIYSLDFNVDLDELPKRTYIILRVKDVPPGVKNAK